MLTFWWSLWPAVHTAPISNQATAKPLHMIIIMSGCCITARELSSENPRKRTSTKLIKIWRANAKDMLEPETQSQIMLYVTRYMPNIPENCIILLNCSQTFLYIKQASSSLPLYLPLSLCSVKL
jgi:hypothetical protein